jgi:hypothetical protein
LNLHDLLVVVFAAGGAWAGVRVEVRLLWRFLRDLQDRVVRLENVALKANR